MFIYKITHKSTHQCYIGQTQDFIKRWGIHLSATDLPIQRAIHAEGIANFTFEILEECTAEEADDRETYWIIYYHAATEGYNTNQGKGKIIHQITTNTPIANTMQRGKKNSPEGVDAYDPMTGQLVCHYASIAEANRALGHEGTGNISAVCRGRGRTAYGYVWRYTTPQDP